MSIRYLLIVYLFDTDEIVLHHILGSFYDLMLATRIYTTSKLVSSSSALFIISSINFHPHFLPRCSVRRKEMFSVPVRTLLVTFRFSISSILTRFYARVTLLSTYRAVIIAPYSLIGCNCFRFPRSPIVCRATRNEDGAPRSRVCVHVREWSGRSTGHLHI